MVVLFLISLSIVLKLAPLPWRLRLEDVPPSTHKLDSNLIDTHLNALLVVQGLDCHVHFIPNCNILFSTSMNAYDEGDFPCKRVFQWLGVSRLLDRTPIITSDVPSFRCSLTGMDADNAIIARLADTTVWFLLSADVGIVEENPLHSTLTRDEFLVMQKALLARFNESNASDDRKHKRRQDFRHI